MKGINQRSYEYIRSKINGKTDFRARHIWIMANGSIPKDMMIHHINNNKQDDRLENLQLVSREEHGKLHKEINKKLKELL